MAAPKFLVARILPVVLRVAMLPKLRRTDQPRSIEGMTMADERSTRRRGDFDERRSGDDARLPTDGPSAGM
jgi:hypothetical protein